MKHFFSWLRIPPAWVALSAIVFAQQPDSSKDKASKLQVADTALSVTAAAVSVPPSRVIVAPSYRYEAKGRRDPFRSLDVVNSIQASSAPTVRPAGLKGQLVSEVNLVGIVQSKGEYIAMATGYRGRTYFIRPTDELYDGRVLQIRSDAVTFSQTLTDSQGKKLSQQVVKKLYATRGEGNDAK
jgi:hypothetical protein